MSAHCCGTPAAAPSADPAYRKVLRLALTLNALMFVVEFGASWSAGSVALGKALWHAQAGETPEPLTMGAVGFAALAVNAGVGSAALQVPRR